MCSPNLIIQGAMCSHNLIIQGALCSHNLIIQDFIYSITYKYTLFFIWMIDIVLGNLKRALGRSDHLGDLVAMQYILIMVLLFLLLLPCLG